MTPEERLAPLLRLREAQRKRAERALAEARGAESRMRERCAAAERIHCAAEQARRDEAAALLAGHAGRPVPASAIAHLAAALDALATQSASGHHNLAAERRAAAKAVADRHAAFAAFQAQERAGERSRALHREWAARTARRRRAVEEAEGDDAPPGGGPRKLARG